MSAFAHSLMLPHSRLLSKLCAGLLAVENRRLPCVNAHEQGTLWQHLCCHRYVKHVGVWSTQLQLLCMAELKFGLQELTFPRGVGLLLCRDTCNDLYDSPVHEQPQGLLSHQIVITMCCSVGLDRSSPHRALLHVFTL